MEKSHEKTIVTTCMSGSGTALKIQEIISNSLNLNDINIKIINIGIGSSTNSKWILANNSNIIAIVGTVDLKIDGVPFISVDELITGNGLQRLEKLSYGTIMPKKSSQAKTESASNVALKNTIEKFLSYLDINKIYPMVYKSYESILKGLYVKSSKQFMIRYITHLACMVERLCFSTPLPYEDPDSILSKNKDKVKIIKNSLNEISKSLQLTIPESELAYLLEIVNDEI